MSRQFEHQQPSRLSAQVHVALKPQHVGCRAPAEPDNKAQAVPRHRAPEPAKAEA